MVLIKEIELALKPQNNEVNAPEDEILADSVLELTKTDFSHVEEHEDIAPGSIRKHVEADMRMAYPGKPTSRKRVFKTQLKTSISDEEGVVSTNEKQKDKIKDHLDSEDEDNLSLSSEQQVKSESSSLNESFEKEGSDSNDSSQDLDSDFDGSILADDNEFQKSSDEDDVGEKTFDESKGIDIFSARTRDIDADIAKGRSIHNQLTIWEKLIECRIKLQPTLLNANKLYQKEALLDFKSSLNSNEEEIVTQAYTALANLMKVLLELQENLLNSVPEYVNTRSLKRKATDEKGVMSNEPEVKKAKPGKDLLEELYENFKPFRNASIQKWNEKTRVSSGKMNKNDFSAFDLPTLKQIEEILLDRERLLRRTRTKRSDYKIFGKSSEVITEDAPSEFEKKKNLNDYDTEIFDDDDFYHKLLRDFIEKKTSDVTDASKRGKQWLELQKLRSRMKSKVDTRASKGRKLRFTVHNKMVNFMAPVPSYTWSNEAKNELFKSLFH